MMSKPVTSQPTGRTPYRVHVPHARGYEPLPSEYAQPGHQLREHDTPLQGTGQSDGGMLASQTVQMNRPQLIPGCPPGVEYLTQIDHLVVQQQFTEPLEIFPGFKARKSYRIGVSMNEQVYLAAQESTHAFVMHVIDTMAQEVIRVTRELKCPCEGYSCCCASADCCRLEVTVEAPPGNVVGYVRQQESCCLPLFIITNAEQETVLEIKGPCCPHSGEYSSSDKEFVVLTRDFRHEVGRITKQWYGSDGYGCVGYGCVGCVRRAHIFLITFPLDLDVKMKAVMLGAMFLIDFMFEE